MASNQRLEPTPKMKRLCPLIAFDAVVGGRYKLRTLWTLRDGPQRYGAIRRSLEDGCRGQPITPRLLSRELKELAARGLITRHEHQGLPLRVDYALTEAGRALSPIIGEIIAWGTTGAHETALGITAVSADAA